MQEKKLKWFLSIIFFRLCSSTTASWVAGHRLVTYQGSHMKHSLPVWLQSLDHINLYHQRKWAKARLASAILCISCFFLITGPWLLKASSSCWQSLSDINVRLCLCSLHSVIIHFMARKRRRLSLRGVGTYKRQRLRAEHTLYETHTNFHANGNVRILHVLIWHQLQCLKSTGFESNAGFIGAKILHWKDQDTKIWTFLFPRHWRHGPAL